MSSGSREGAAVTVDPSAREAQPLHFTPNLLLLSIHGKGYKLNLKAVEPKHGAVAVVCKPVQFRPTVRVCAHARRGRFQQAPQSRGAGEGLIGRQHRCPAASSTRKVRGRKARALENAADFRRVMAGRKGHWSCVSGSPSVRRQSRLLGGENRREEKKEERERGWGKGQKSAGR